MKDQAWLRLRETARHSAEYASVLAIIDDETLALGLGLRRKVDRYLTEDGSLLFAAMLGDPVELEDWELDEIRCRRCEHSARDHASPQELAEAQRTWREIAACRTCGTEHDDSCSSPLFRDLDSCYLSGGERALIELAAGLWNGRPFDITDVLCRLGDYHLEVAFRAMRIRAGLEAPAGAL